MDDLLGFSLSQEELLAALLILDIPVPAGFDDLPTRVFGDMPEAARVSLMAATERGLIARGFLRTPEEAMAAHNSTVYSGVSNGSDNVDLLVLDDYVQQALKACSNPKKTWLLLHQPVGEMEQASYFHLHEQHIYGQVELLGIHQYLELPERQTLFETILQLITPNAPQLELSQNNGGTLKEQTFAELVASPHPPTGSSLQEQLQKGGLDSEYAIAFAQTIEELVSITAMARFGYDSDSHIENAFTVVCGQNTHWVLTLAVSGTLQITNVSTEIVRQIIQEFVMVAD